MPSVEKTIEVPTGTEIDVNIDLDDFLDDVESEDILDVLVRDIGCKQIFRTMQMQHDFEKEDIEEAVGKLFVSDEPTPLTYSDIHDAIENGNMSDGNKFALLRTLIKGM